jgi:anti-sigma regulatory factor (Ser/Thr protein kinase)
LGRSAAERATRRGRGAPLREQLDQRPGLYRYPSTSGAGLPPHRVEDLVIAIAELAANTLAHTSGPGEVTFWVTANEVVCQVQDQGEISDPQAGKVRPAPDAPGGGRGLWLVHEVCDQVDIRTGQAGTTVRVHMRRGAGPA